MDHKEVKALIAGFEDGSWPAAQWTHKSHVYMAVWYLSMYSDEEATHRIKSGIKQYNVSQGGQNTASSGYHETITEFYIRILRVFLSRSNFVSKMVDWKSLSTQPFMDKDFPLRFYSEAYLMHPSARAAWCEPDIQPLKVYENTLQV